MLIMIKNTNIDGPLPFLEQLAKLSDAPELLADFSALKKASFSLGTVIH